IPRKTVIAIQYAKNSGRKILAVGTTVARTLEYCAEDILSGFSGSGGVQGDNENQMNRTRGTENETRRQTTQQSAENVSSAPSSAGWQADMTRKLLTGEADIF